MLSKINKLRHLEYFLYINNQGLNIQMMLVNQLGGQIDRQIDDIQEIKVGSYSKVQDLKDGGMEYKQGLLYICITKAEGTTYNNNNNN